MAAMRSRARSLPCLTQPSAAVSASRCAASGCSGDARREAPIQGCEFAQGRDGFEVRPRVIRQTVASGRHRHRALPAAPARAQGTSVRPAPRGTARPAPRPSRALHRRAQHRRCRRDRWRAPWRWSPGVRDWTAPPPGTPAGRRRGTPVPCVTRPPAGQRQHPLRPRRSPACRAGPRTAAPAGSGHRPAPAGPGAGSADGRRGCRCRRSRRTCGCSGCRVRVSYQL